MIKYSGYLSKTDLERLQEVNRLYQRKMTATCCPLKELGVSFFSFFRIYHDSTYTVLQSSNKLISALIQNYAQGVTESLVCNLNRCYNGDIKYCLGTGMPKSTWDKFSHRHNFWNYLSIFKKSNHYLDAFTFYGLRQEPEIVQMYVNHHHLLDRFSLYFESEMLSILNDTNIFIKSHLVCGQPKTTDHLYPDSSYHRFKEKTQIQKFRLNDKIALTERQIKCLYYASRGKKVKEIARLLNISPRTVQWHMNCLKEISNMSFSRLIDCFLESTFSHKELIFAG